MTYPGPWQQGPDFERAAKKADGQGRIESQHVSGGTVQSGYDAKEIANNATSLAKQQAPQGPGSGDISATTRMDLYVGTGWDGGALPPATAEAVGAYDARTLTLYPSLALPADPPLPQGATGVEWEANVCAPVTAVWDFSGSDTYQQWYETAGAGVAYGGMTNAHLTVSTDNAQLTSTSYAAPYEIAVATFGAGSVGLSIPDPVDLTAYLRPDGKFLAAVDIDPLGFDSVDSTSNQTAYIGVTVGISRLLYTLRPPRYRFLYATPQTPPGLPPLRQHPRRDGLGASTARRHYPPDRSVQASNRRAGGYF